MIGMTFGKQHNVEFQFNMLYSIYSFGDFLLVHKANHHLIGMVVFPVQRRIHFK